METYQIINKKLNLLESELKKINLTLYNNPEVGGEEVNSSRILCESLSKHGFTITSNYYGIQNAFRAEFAAKKNGPTIGLMAEMDALPDIGHGCGHNLIASISIGTAHCLKSVVEDTGGKIVVYGTPGEENLCTKVELTNKGAFDECDIAMMVHPNPVTYASKQTKAIESLQIDFHGRNSHAGVEPQKGINALDAAMLCYHSIGIQKQYHLDTNLYGIVKNGGEKASIIPAFASLAYLSRANTMQELKSLRKMVENCALAASTSTGATYTLWNNEETNYNLITNIALGDRFNEHLTSLGEKTIIHENMNGSTDMGDVSHRIPSIHPWVGLNMPELALHTREFAEATVSTEGINMMMRSILALSYTGYDVLTDRALLEKIKEEFRNTHI